MNRKFFVMIGSVLLVVGFLLFVSVVLNLPSGYWSPGLFDVRWLKINGLTVVNEKVQFVLDPSEKGGGPTSAELTQLALKADPSFFDGCPVGQNIDLVTYDKFYPIAQTFTQKYEGALISSLYFQLTPAPSKSVYGYIGAFACVVIGLILVRSGRSKTKQMMQQLSGNPVKPGYVSLQSKQVEGQEEESKPTPVRTERKQVVRPAHENICPKCGYAAKPKDRFCRKCGNPLK